MEFLPINGEEAPQDVGEYAGGQALAKFGVTVIRPGCGLSAQSVFFQPLK